MNQRDTDRRFDLVLENGDFRTMDPDRPRARSIGIVDGRIAAVGDAPALEDAEARSTIDLGGRTALPGINDSHVHSALHGVAHPPVAIDLSYPGTSTIEQVRDALRKAVAVTPAGEWIRGNGFDGAVLREDAGRWPNARDLDDIAPDHPVILVEYSSHLCWVNSAALRIAGVDAGTPDPAGGVVVRGETGEPDGVLMENAQDLVGRVVPDYTEAQIREAIRAAGRSFVEQGITSITDAALGPGGDARVGGAFGSIPLRVLAEWAGSEEFPIRTGALMVTDPEVGFEPIRAALEQTASPRGEEWFRVAGVKLFADGVPPSRTAYMSEDYCGGGHGTLMAAGDDETAQQEAFDRLIGEIHAAGYQMGVHATGDLAASFVTRSLARAQRASARDLRHYLIHADFVDDETLALLAEHGWGINTQPAIKWATADAMVPIVGPERAAEQWPIRRMIDAGVAVGFSSDAPITSPKWQRGVVSAVLRESRDTGAVSGPEQRIRADEALAAYTRNGAWFDRAEAWKGMLRTGMVADLCVLDLPLGDDVRELEETGVQLTMVDGAVRFERG